MALIGLMALIHADGSHRADGSLKKASPADENVRARARFESAAGPRGCSRGCGIRGRAILIAGETTQIQVNPAFQRVFGDGEIIFDEGDAGIDLYVIQSGQVQISRSSAAGERVVAKLGPGEFFGEMSVVLGEARTASAVSVGRTELLELDGETLEAMCIERPEIAIRMIQRLAIRLIGAERRLAALGLDELVGPLIRYLSVRAANDLDEELRLRTTLRELASGCKLTLQETHQALHELMDQKLIRLVGDELIAPDPAALSTAMTRFVEAG